MASTMALFFKNIFAPFFFMPSNQDFANFSPCSLMRAVTKAWNEALLGAIPTLFLNSDLVRSLTERGKFSMAPGR